MFARLASQVQVQSRNDGSMLIRRLVQLYAGLTLYGVSGSFIVLAGLGNDPWDVFHQGLSRRIGLGIGTWVIIVGALVLLLWIPLRQRPGLGTVSNVIVVGGVMDVMLALFDQPGGLFERVALLVAGVGLNGVATGMYIGARFGPGPRDGLMTGLAARGHSIRVVRTGIELTVLAIGFALGGTVGLGTIVYAVSIGPLAHIFVPLFTVPQVAANAQAHAVTATSAADAIPSAGALAASATQNAR
jgi:uncharacterized membrane protein YczE